MTERNCPSSEPDALTCEGARNLLQAHWDGEEPLDRPDLAAHLAGCPACRQWQALATRVQAALDHGGEPLVPFGLSQRIVRVVHADQRARLFRRWAGVGATIAATLALVFFFFMNPFRDPAAPAPLVERPPVEPKGPGDVPSLPRVEGLTQARVAIVDWTRDTAERTASQTAGLIPSFDLQVGDLLPDAEESPMGVEPVTLEPATRPLNEIRDGASVALRPVGDSARRAFRLFAGGADPLPR